jgi:hypothetical protein
VDVEYDHQGRAPKRLGLPEECADYIDENGEALAVPDVIVYQGGKMAGTRW